MNIKERWLIYTVLIGLVPFFSRFLFYIVFDELDESFLFQPQDFIAFGLVLHISIINEASGLKTENWMLIFTGFSVIMIILYALLFSLTLLLSIYPKIDINSSSLIFIVLVFNLASFIMSFTVFHRINKLRISNDK